jgi:hypothetical protein
MANRYAVKTGVWSDTTVWDGGTLPVAGDDVRSNNFTVTVNQNINVATLTNTALAPAVAGGGFQVTQSGVTIAANIIGGTTTSAIALNYNMGVSGSVSTLNGNITGGTANVTPGVSIAGSVAVTININGIVTGGSVGGGSSANSTGLNIGNGLSIINLVGDVYPGPSGNGSGIVCNNGILNIVGNVYGGGATTSTTNIGINSAGTINITGNIIGNGLNFAILNGTITTVLTGSFNVIGSGTSTTAAISSTVNAPNFVVKNIVNTTTSVAISGRVRISTNNPTCQVVTPSGTTLTLTDPNITNPPTISNVRFGTVYGGGAFTGTMIVPTASAVSYGVPVDNTVGTSLLNPQDLFNAISSSSDPVAVRLRTTSTIQITGDQIASLT